MFGLSSQLYISTTFPQTHGPHHWHYPVQHCCYSQLINKKKSSTLPLTFHFSNSPSFLSIFFVYQIFSLFSVSFSAFSVSPLFNLYLGVGWVSRWRLGFWGRVTTVCCGSALGWCFSGVDRCWVGGFTVFCLSPPTSTQPTSPCSPAFKWSAATDICKFFKPTSVQTQVQKLQTHFVLLFLFFLENPLRASIKPTLVQTQV